MFLNLHPHAHYNAGRKSEWTAYVPASNTDGFLLVALCQSLFVVRLIMMVS